MIVAREVEIVVCMYRDRIVRFGWDLFEWICQSHGVEIKVLAQQEQTPSEEVADDLLAITTYFVNKANGRRKYTCKNKS